MSNKVTQAQRALLKECISDPRGITGAVAHYSPAVSLVRKGFATWRDNDPFSERLIITPAGRALIQLETQGTE